MSLRFLVLILSYFFLFVQAKTQLPVTETKRLISKVFNRTCWPQAVYWGQKQTVWLFFCCPKLRKLYNKIYDVSLYDSRQCVCWWGCVWRVLRVIYCCNYKLERLLPPCCENEKNMDAGEEGISYVCVCVYVNRNKLHAVLRLCTSHGLIPRLSALAYTPVPLLKLIHPPILLYSQSPKILRTEYQFNLGVTFALRTLRWSGLVTYCHLDINLFLLRGYLYSLYL